MLRRRSAILASLALTAPSAGAAQFCLHGGRLPKCQTVAVTEFMVGARFTEAEALTEVLLVASSELGVLVNSGARSAFGTTLMAGVNGGGTRLGLKGRYRHWLGESVALDLAPGVLVAGTTSASTGSLRTPGFTGQLALGWKDWFGVALQYENLRYLPDDLGSPEQTDASLAILGRVGSSAGIVATVLAVGFLIVYGISVSQLD